MHGIHIGGWAVPLLGIAFWALPAPAQEAKADTLACLSAGQTLRTERRGQKYQAALKLLRRCPQIGPRALVGEWSEPPSDGDAIRHLATTSGQVRDARVHAATAAVARRSGGDRTLRLAAIGALVAHFDPCLSVIVREPARPNRGGRGYVSLGQFDHDPSAEGSEPLTGSVREDVIRLLRGIGAGDSDEVVQAVSAYLADTLASRTEPLECSSSFIVRD